MWSLYETIKVMRCGVCSSVVRDLQTPQPETSTFGRVSDVWCEPEASQAAAPSLYTTMHAVARELLGTTLRLRGRPLDSPLNRLAVPVRSSGTATIKVSRAGVTSTGSPVIIPHR